MGTYYIKEDDGEPTIRAELLNANDNPVNLSGTTVKIRVVEARGGKNVINDTANIVTANNGIVSYDFSKSQTEDDGRYRLEWVVDYGEQGFETFPNAGHHTLLISRNAAQ